MIAPNTTAFRILRVLSENETHSMAQNDLAKAAECALPTFRERIRPLSDAAFAREHRPSTRVIIWSLTAAGIEYARAQGLSGPGGSILPELPRDEPDQEGEDDRLAILERLLELERQIKPLRNEAQKLTARLVGAS